MKRDVRLAWVLLAIIAVLPSRGIAAPKPAVAVLYFDNDTGDVAFEHLGKGLADMMITHLASVPSIRVVEREKLEELLKELKLQQTRYFDSKTGLKIGRGIGAEYAVTGAFLSMAPDIRIDVRVVRIASGEVVAAKTVVGRQEHFFELLQKLASALIDGLGPALGGDAGKIAASQQENRVDDLQAAVDYGRGLDFNDRGDLKSAAEEMQKTVQRAPRFALAKTRQMEILRALYAAKDTRSKELRTSEDILIERVDRRLAELERRGDEDEELFAFRILRGDILLRQVAQSVNKPKAELRARLDAYRKNQERHLDEAMRHAHKHTTDYEMRVSCLKCIDDDTNRLVRELELHHPSLSESTSPHEIAMDLAALLMFGVVPEDSRGPRVKMERAVCFYKLDAAYAKASLAALDRGLQAVDEQAAAERDRAGGWREERTIDLYQLQAVVFLALGKPEEAVAKLQAILTRYPKSRHFAETEAYLRAALSGKDRLPDGHPLLPACVDPK
jgi:TolB-like protein